VDLQQLFSRIKAATSGFSAAQLATMVVAFLLVVGVVGGSAWWMNRPTYALLYSDMDADAASQVVTRLKTLKVAYQLDDGGRAVRVPADRVDELRLDLSSQVMPASGRIGFEIFDRTAFGATEFLEQVNYRRALEGEIGRTIATLSEVASARVHIAMGKDSLFGESRPAKASVVLKLRGQRALTASTVNGISNLIAASVEGLRPESVVILDSFGRPLAKPDSDPNDPLGAAQLERQQRIERDMSARVVALLEPVVGQDHVRVNVAVRLNPETLDQTEERWDPNSVLRSRQMSADGANAAGSLAGGPAGARANAPPDPKAPPQGQPSATGLAAGGPSRTAETTTYEIGRLTRRTMQPPGEVERLSVAVIVDDDQVESRDKDGRTLVKHVPRKHEDLQKLQGLVAAAVGLDTMRGDQLTVENVAFDDPAVDDGPPPSVLERITPQIWQGGRILAIAGIAIVALLFLIRPMLHRAGVQVVQPRVETSAAAPPQIRTVADLESEIEAQLEAAIQAKQNESRKLPVLTRRVAALTEKEPENIARLLRSWMVEGER
jgi:flagellar M-ring protein FliF